MTYLTVEYWGMRCRGTRTLVVDDSGYGVIDENARKVFSAGQCHALALAIHELTGWPIKGIGNRYNDDEPQSPAHCVVWCPPLKKYVDIKGAKGRDYYRRRNNWKVLASNVQPQQVQSFERYLTPNMKAARVFAKTVLRDLEISTGNLKK